MLMKSIRLKKLGISGMPYPFLLGANWNRFLLLFHLFHPTRNWDWHSQSSTSVAYQDIMHLRYRRRRVIRCCRESSPLWHRCKDHLFELIESLSRRVWFKRKIIRKSRLASSTCKLFRLSLILPTFLMLAGIYLSADGFLNTFYWRSSDQPWAFQAGRILRGLIGVGMIVAGLMR